MNSTYLALAGGAIGLVLGLIVGPILAFTLPVSLIVGIILAIVAGGIGYLLGDDSEAVISTSESMEEIQ